MYNFKDIQNDIWIILWDIGYDMGYIGYLWDIDVRYPIIGYAKDMDLYGKYDKDMYMGYMDDWMILTSVDQQMDLQMDY